MTKISGIIKTTPRLVIPSEIDPDINQAFSPNLWRWMKKNTSQHQQGDRWILDGEEYIGWIDDNQFLIGSRLWGILCNGRSEQTYAYPLTSEPEHKPLWEDYLVRGRCAIDPEHEHYFIDERFETKGTSRVCKWCGHKQIKETYTVEVIKERWVNV